jgi:imidazole glycerol-phosphate synthase subunit HisF
MLRPRIIPCLLIHNGGLVKTRQFSAPKYVGDPLNAVRIFNEKEVDELMVLDIDATVHQREPDYTLIRHLAGECRMPLCYGGGVRTPEQVERIIGLGVEKVSLGAAAVEVPELIETAARRVGNQSVVVVLDVKKGALFKGFELRTRNGTTKVAGDPAAFAAQAEALGAGEIVVNAIHEDGMMQGYDLALVRRIREAVNCPLTVLGGAGSLDHLGALIREFGLIGAAAGSLFVFKGKYRAVLINYPNRNEKAALLQSAHFCVEA